MRNWYFVRSWRWAGYLAFVIAFAVACVLLSNWQIDRREQVVAANHKIEANYDSAPVPLDAALPTLDSFRAAQEWSQVSMVGQYESDKQLLVRTRPLNGNPGFEVLVPFRPTDGDLFIVDRGWVPVGTRQDAPDSVPAPPSGQVSVVARLKPGEARLPGRSAPEGQVATIELDDIRSILKEPVHTGAYGLMVSEDPAPATRPQPLPKPATDEGPHLSYAFQWIVFGVLAFVALGWAVRQEYRNFNAHEPAERERAAERERRRKARVPGDADIEDAIVDAQVSSPSHR